MQVTTAEHVRGMRDALQALCDDVGTFLNSSSLLPVADSPARVEMADKPLSDQLLNAYHQGGLLLESAGDHAIAVARLLIEPVASVASWTCARGALEASAMSCWLLAGDITARERVSRSYAYRYAGLREQEKLARSSGDKVSLQSVQARMDAVENQAVGLEYARVLDRNGKRIGVGQVLLTNTALIQQAFGEETMYRIFSGMAHSYSSPLIQLSFPAFDPSLRTLRTKAMNSDAAAILVLTAADSLTKPLWAKARLFGLDMNRLAQILASRYEEMGFNDSRSHWLAEGPS